MTQLPQFMRNHAAIHDAEPGACAACDDVRVKDPLDLLVESQQLATVVAGYDAGDDCPYGVTPVHADCAEHGYGRTS